MAEATTTSEPVKSPVRPRIWPGVAILAFFAFLLFVPGEIAPRTTFHFMSIAGGLLLSILGFILWWAFYSRTPGKDRVMVLLVFIAAAVVVANLIPPSHIMGLLLYAFPLVAVLCVGWLITSQPFSWQLRRSVLLLLIMMGWSTMLLVRIKNVNGDMIPDLRWVWSKTSDELREEESASRKAGKQDDAPLQLVSQPGDWTEFRGAHRDSKAVNTRIRTDWEKDPPKLLWKRRIGLGWSSFSVVGDLLFTQEQRLQDECVVCYNAKTGDEIWKFSVNNRFVDAVGGDGPRGTPTIKDGRLYAQGATGKLVCLDAATGKQIWIRDIGIDANGHAPQWGYAGSPLVSGNLVFAIPLGANSQGTIAYDKETGNPVWKAGEAQHTYSSPQEVTFFGTRQILVLSDFGLESFNPADGKSLWQFPLTVRGMNRVVQPNVIGEGEVLLGTGSGKDLGTQLIKVRKDGESWTAEAGWNSNRLKPYYNDFVTHDGYAYGFDDSIFVCISLKDGKLKWKGGRYGHGQVLLLPDQSKLLVSAEDGKVHLLDATPNELTELGEVKVFDGRTWNHPVVVRGKLFIRNDEEMACYDLTETGSMADPAK
ncbi:PQQ-like beta-propeller repeat protein [Telmatocola sphagniphila]|uniref:PQQ-like beta-propeller repeat protein n=1 Tax=Telmatocola sphagniphila TaxID=1123043 RepID=A0A8E6EV80_9BACT|nr:PQQ-binding-like beta-propeller repeat protein [Telmatocola sphagniphila]QVL34609.1 PQQ-like beta-propeller repeat protein [Telmatocola sphagniphila]